MLNDEDLAEIVDHLTAIVWTLERAMGRPRLVRGQRRAADVDAERADLEARFVEALLGRDEVTTVELCETLGLRPDRGNATVVGTLLQKAGWTVVRKAGSDGARVRIYGRPSGTTEH